MLPSHIPSNMSVVSTVASTNQRRPPANHKRQRSRHMAHTRRQFENGEFERLAVALPIPTPISSQLLDKTSIVRLAISTMQLHEYATCRGLMSNTGEELLPPHIACDVGSLILEAFDGFMMILSCDATVLYVSETISVGLGLSQIEMIGNYIDDYMPQSDAYRLRQVCQVLKQQAATVAMNSDFWLSQPTQFSVRIRSTLNRRSCRQRMRCGYKVIQMCVCARYQQYECIGFSVLASTVPGTLGNIPIDQHSFVVSTNLDLTVYYIDIRGEQVLGYTNAKHFVDKNVKLYSLVDVGDTETLAKLHSEVLELSASGECLLRLINAQGELVWLQTSATLICRQPRRSSNQRTASANSNGTGQCISFIFTKLCENICEETTVGHAWNPQHQISHTQNLPELTPAPSNTNYVLHQLK